MGLHPPHGLALLAVIVGIGVWTISVSPGELDSGLGMILFVQMFLASSGFLVRARRGHFDPVILGATDRTGAVMWHWLVSVAPGAAGWICLAVTGYWLGSPMAVSALVGRRAIALFIVSALAWAAGFALARGAAGVMWTAALVGLLLRAPDLLSSTTTPSLSVEAVLRHSATLLICPFLLIGNHPPLASYAVCGAAGFSAVLLVIVWRLSGRLDIYLVERA
jgi:hypothetical protein